MRNSHFLCVHLIAFGSTVLLPPQGAKSFWGAENRTNTLRPWPVYRSLGISMCHHMLLTPGCL